MKLRGYLAEIDSANRLIFRFTNEETVKWPRAPPGAPDKIPASRAKLINCGYGRAIHSQSFAVHLPTWAVRHLAEFVDMIGAEHMVEVKVVPYNIDGTVGKKLELIMMQ